jgi:hypothetical protein
MLADMLAKAGEARNISVNIYGPRLRAREKRLELADPAL